jgi:hypothetical protein
VVSVPGLVWVLVANRSQSTEAQTTLTPNPSGAFWVSVFNPRTQTYARRSTIALNLAPGAATLLKFQPR